ncbi:unnamed protein product [Notodromas monacha]|uniref:VWFA domain-containing protein n=1 Tax=Notodromas monacha TaxID=399045 RepID=A0A7R9GAR4_9CRUS|nr:unnamed protein product [Notodromas monacha]CAG0914269.1 unnamed protein product [Notodromas monacha]
MLLVWALISFEVVHRVLSALPDDEVMKLWTDGIDNDLQHVFYEATGVAYLDSDLGLSENWIRGVDEALVMNQVAANAKEIFRKRLKSLENLAKQAEEAAQSAGKRRPNKKSKKPLKYNKMITPHLTNDIDCDISSWPGSEQFCRNFSTIHFPVELYANDKRVKDVVAWTKPLDEVFKENFDEDPSLKWQYFAGKDGVYRRYPGSNWPTKKTRNHEMFDVRKQTFYERTVASPKDVVILVDVSGSMQGHVLQITKLAIKMLLNSLTEDDYFGVVKFSATPETVGCWGESLIPATTPYKRAMFEEIDNLTTFGQADLGRAVEFSCELIRQFQNSRQSEEGAQCHKTVMLFTDGGVEWPQRAAVKCNQIGVRLFTYAMGNNPTPIVPVKRLACETQGFFTAVHGMSAIRPKIIDSYLPVLSRPKAMSRANSFPEDVSWTAGFSDPGPLRDSGGYLVEISQGLGYAIAMTVSVYNSTEYDGKEVQELVGVVGIDVPWQELLENVIPQKINAMNYFFAVDQNGIVVYHPNLPEQLPLEQEPPNLDFLQFVGETTRTVTARRKLINAGAAAVMNHLDSTLTLGDRYLLTGTYSVTYVALEPSPYKLALVSLGFPRMVEITEGYTPKEMLKKLGNDGQTGVRLAPWQYCGTAESGLQNAQRTATDLATLRTLVASSAADDNPCETPIARQLMFDLLKTEKLATSFWTNKANNEDTIAMKFISTVGGLTRFAPVNRAEDLRVAADPAKNDFLWRGIMHKGLLSVDLTGKGNEIERKRNKKPSTITFFKGVTFQRGSITYPYAVVGVDFADHFIQDVFLKAASNLPGSRGGNALDEVSTCVKNGPLDCFLLDDAGSIVASNQDRSNIRVGGFYGTIDPLGFHKLLEYEVYFSKEFFDYQGKCSKRTDAVGATWKLISPVEVVFNVVQGFFSVGFWNSLKLGVYSWTFPDVESATMDRSDDDPGPVRHDDEHSCITREVRYWLNPEEGTSMLDLVDIGLGEEEDGSGWTVGCENCTRGLKAMKLPNSRLVLVVAEALCECEAAEPRVEHWIPKPASGHPMCQRKHQYRKRIHHCYNEHPSETGPCTGSGSSRPGVHILAAVLAMGLLFGRP